LHTLPRAAVFEDRFGPEAVFDRSPPAVDDLGAVHALLSVRGEANTYRREPKGGKTTEP